MANNSFCLMLDKIKKIALIISVLLIFPLIAIGQITEVEEDLIPEQKEEEEFPEGWSNGGMFSLSFSQVSLTNWSAGGENSISGNSLVNLFANYRRNTFIWSNTFDLGYGLQKREGENSRKTDDRIELSSKAGIQATGDWFYAGFLNFRTQLAPGYDYAVDGNEEISNFLSPAYILAAIGMDYRPSDNFSMFIAPVTGKFTIVKDQILAGTYGLDEDQTIRTEFGGYVRALYRVNLTDLLTLQTKFDLFSNYLDKPQNIDINWENLLMMNITEYIAVNFMTHLIYDDDVMIGVDSNDDGEIDSEGPRVQFKQLLGVGFSFSF